MAIDEILNKIRECNFRQVGDEKTDSLVDLVVAIDGLDKMVKNAAKIASDLGTIVERHTVDRFITESIDGVKKRGKNLILATEYWPKPKVSDLLPEGVTEDHPDYEATVATVRAAAKDRMIRALKEDPNLSLLVEETVNASKLRSALTGEEAERDELDVPVLPESLRDIVDLGEQNVIRIRKA